MKILNFPAGKFPSLRLVVDHISKPYMWRGEEAGLAGWREDMARAARHQNVFCKLSGLVTEVDPDHHNTPWTPHTFRSTNFHLRLVPSSY